MVSLDDCGPGDRATIRVEIKDVVSHSWRRVTGDEEFIIVDHFVGHFVIALLDPCPPCCYLAESQHITR